MRYTNEEVTGLVGKLGIDEIVTIKVVHIPSDTLVEVASDICIESDHIPGMYMWDTSNMGVPVSGAYMYEMTDGTKVSPGKFTIGGAMDNLSEILTALGSINTEADFHTWLDSYVNKDDWKGQAPSVEEIYSGTWGKII